MEDEYQIGEVVGSSNVPNWARRPLKYSDLIERILRLEDGEEISIRFENGKLAKPVRDAIRNRLNTSLDSDVLVRTRIEQNENGDGVTVYFVSHKSSFKKERDSQEG